MERQEQSDRSNFGGGHRGRPGEVVVIDSSGHPVDDGTAHNGTADNGTAGGHDLGWLGGMAREVLRRALTAELRDDRFDGDWPSAGLVAAVELDRSGRPSGYLGGPVSDRTCQLDGLLAEDANIDGPPDERADRLWRALAPSIEASPADTIELWARPALSWHRSLAERHGLTELRALHQLRCTLPIAVDVAPLPSRPFRPGDDEDALIRINNRAFASHPDQGTMTRESLAEAAAQPWFDPDGIRLHDDPDHPGVLAGVCWTKIHEPVADGQPRLGEIYVIGIDPDHHGRGLGVAMTAAGLRWLSDRGLTTGMLYVEADNEPAMRTYDRLGFGHHRTDRAWHGPVTR